MRILNPLSIQNSTLIYSEPKPITANSILVYRPDLYSNNTLSLFDFSSTSGNTGTIANDSWHEISYEPPKMFFDAFDDYIYTTTQYVNPQVFSLSFWYRTAFKDGKKIIGFENQRNSLSANYDRQCYVGTNGHLYFGVNDGGSGKYATYNVDTSDYMWRHVVATYSNVTKVMQLFINGQLFTTTSLVNGAEVNTGYWRIGSYKASGWTNGADGYFGGEISFPSIYHRVLTVDEIKQLFYANNYLFTSKQVKLGYTGGIQQFVIPENVYSIDIALAGAQGGDGSTGQTGGLGGNVFTKLSVTPGQSIYVSVGGCPGTSPTPKFGGGGLGRANGTTGGAGGGYTAIFNSITINQTNVMAIAGGGGGGAGNILSNGNYTGGAGAATGSSGSGTRGNEPANEVNLYGTNYGFGGTLTAGGAAGTAFDTNSIAPQAGSALQGGNGGFAAGYNGGAGGGGGYYGGGGSAAGGRASGGGGGGSSYSDSYAYYGETNVGDGYAVLSWFTQQPDYEPGFRYYKWRILETKTAGSITQASEFGFTQNNSLQRYDVNAITNPGGSNTPSSTEGCNKLMDYNLGTKWVDGSITTNLYTDVIFDYGVGQKRRYYGYTWATANDNAGRDPADWVVLGSNDDSTYYVLDVISGYTATSSRNVWTDLQTIDGGMRIASFSYTGSEQSWTSPDGVTDIWVLAAGAKGGNGSTGRPGGKGAVIYTKVSITPNTTYKIVVGGSTNSTTAVYGYGGNGGTNGDNTNNAGAGGGLSGIFTTSVTTANAIVVAGGGGSGGGNPTYGAGGAAGALSTGAGSIGGYSSSYPNVPGRGGTQSAAGVAGTPFDVQSVNPTAGSDVQGGNGGSTSNSGHNGGGAGGGGYYGGGGGAAGGTATGGGGGGASYSTGTVLYSSLNNTGDGYLTICY